MMDKCSGKTTPTVLFVHLSYFVHISMFCSHSSLLVLYGTLQLLPASHSGFLNHRRSAVQTHQTRLWISLWAVKQRSGRKREIVTTSSIKEETAKFCWSLNQRKKLFCDNGNGSQRNF